MWPARPTRASTAREQFRIGQGKLLQMTFADFEASIRDELDRMLGAGGFSSARDIAAITVNRWPHGYGYVENSLFDADDYDADLERARQRGRARRDRQFGRRRRRLCASGDRPGGARRARAGELTDAERNEMSRMRRTRAWSLGFRARACLTAGARSPALAQTEFPFEREMVLDVKPLPGSKRVPMLEILADGRAMIDLWCKSGEGRAEVKGDAIKFTLGPMREDGCTPERLQRDEDLATALAQVTEWQLEDDEVVVLDRPDRAALPAVDALRRRR